METRRCVIRGRVQGVGFRYFVLRQARSAGIRGSVQNRADGTVEAILQSDSEAALDALVERLREGPGRVDAIEVEPVEETNRYLSFEVTH